MIAAKAEVTPPPAKRLAAPKRWRGEHEARHSSLPRCIEQRATSLDVGLRGGLGISSAGRVADDRGEVDDLVDPAQGGLTRRRVANVSADRLHAGGLEVGRDRLLSMQQAIEHPHVATSQHQLMAGERANVAGSAGD